VIDQTDARLSPASYKTFEIDGYNLNVFDEADRCMGIVWPRRRLPGSRLINPGSLYERDWLSLGSNLAALRAVKFIH
jgi:hypothetical protein